MKELAQNIDTIQREIERRENEYPFLVAAQKMTIQEAEAELYAMRSVLSTLEFLQPPEEQANNALYNKCMGEYRKFHIAQVNTAPNLTGKLAKTHSEAMKNIIIFLKSESKTKDDEGVLRSWQFILSKWPNLSHFIGKQIALPDIHRNLANILKEIKDGHNKKSAADNSLDEHERSLAERRRAATGNDSV